MKQLALFLVLGFLPALGGAFTDAQGAWYQGLEKPPFNPPPWLFGPVWTTLFVMIGLSFHTLHRKLGRFTPRLWALVGFHQLANLLWTPAFFGLESLELGLVVLAFLLLAIAALLAVQWKSSRLSFALFVPYTCWVCFATVLNASLLWLAR